jgi:hypothetical protein
MVKYIKILTKGFIFNGITVQTPSKGTCPQSLDPPWSSLEDDNIFSVNVLCT